MLSLRTTKIQDSNSNLFCLQVRELNVEAAKLTSSHPNAAQDIEWKRHELEEAWANLREQVFNVINSFVPLVLMNINTHFWCSVFKVHYVSIRLLQERAN